MIPPLNPLSFAESGFSFCCMLKKSLVGIQLPNLKEGTK